MKSLLATRFLPSPALLASAVLGAAVLAVPALAQVSTCTVLPGTSCRENIPDGGIRRGTPFVGTLTSTMAVPAGACGAVTNVVDVNVLVRLKHNWIGDLRLRLVHPDGTTSATLLQNPGGPPAGDSGEDLDVTFNDEPAGGGGFSEIPVLSGQRAPVSSLSAFDGLPRAGAWTLEVVDSRGGNYGALDDWTLDMPCVLPVVSVAATAPNAVEQPSTAGTFTFTRTGDTTLPLLVPYSIGGVATPGADYTPLSGVATIPAGATTVLVYVLPLVDALFDNGESVTVTLGPGDYTIGVGIATVMIWDSPGLVGQLDRTIPTTSGLGLALLALAVAAAGAGLVSRRLLG